MFCLQNCITRGQVKFLIYQTNLSSLLFGDENARVVILLNRPKGRKVTLRPFVGDSLIIVRLCKRTKSR